MTAIAVQNGDYSPAALQKCLADHTSERRSSSRLQDELERCLAEMLHGSFPVIVGSQCNDRNQWPECPGRQGHRAVSGRQFHYLSASILDARPSRHLCLPRRQGRTIAWNRNARGTGVHERGIDRDIGHPTGSSSSGSSNLSVSRAGTGFVISEGRPLKVQIFGLSE
jgi:hypothetical protein